MCLRPGAKPPTQAEAQFPSRPAYPRPPSPAARASHEEAPVSDTPEDLCLRRELDAAVRRAIADLPQRCREIFVLRRRDQLGYREIALRLGVSLGTVKSQMWRATVRLKEQLAPHLAPPVAPASRNTYRLL